MIRRAYVKKLTVGITTGYEEKQDGGLLERSIGQGYERIDMLREIVYWKWAEHRK